MKKHMFAVLITIVCVVLNTWTISAQVLPDDPPSTDPTPSDPPPPDDPLPPEDPPDDPPPSEPPPTEPPPGGGEAGVRILPLGDSNTSSLAPHSSYRYWLWQQLNNAGYDVNFVGTLFGVEGGEPALADYDQDHEGHPGWTSQDMLYSIDAIASTTQPEVVLLDLGSNDIADGFPVQRVVDNLHVVIAELRAVNPNVVVLLASPTPYVGPNSKKMGKLNSAIHRLARVENRSASPVIYVNLYSGFSPRRDTFDGVHPNESGERKIAKKYFKALKRVL